MLFEKETKKEERFSPLRHILIYLLIAILISVAYVSWYVPRYEGILQQLSADGRCSYKARKYIEDWSQKVTASDDQLSITTVPGSSRIYYNEKTLSCLALLQYTRHTNDSVQTYQALANTRTSHILTTRLQVTGNGNSTDSNPGFLKEVEKYTTE
jgi:hypothetical protein